MKPEKPLRINKVCRSCNKPFSISEKELNWLEERDLKPFEHCKECRARRRGQKEPIKSNKRHEFYDGL